MHTFLPNDAVFWPIPFVEGGWFNESHINEHHLAPGWRPLLTDEVKSHDAGDCCMAFQETFYERSRVDMSRGRSEMMIYITRRALPDSAAVQSPDVAPEDLTDEQKILRCPHIPRDARQAIIDLPANRGVGGVVMSSLTVNAPLLEIEWPGEMPDTIEKWSSFLSSIKVKEITYEPAPSPPRVTIANPAPAAPRRDGIRLSCTFTRNETRYIKEFWTVECRANVYVPIEVVEQGEDAVREYCDDNMTDQDYITIEETIDDSETYDYDYDGYEDCEVEDDIVEAMNQAGYDEDGNPLEPEEEEEEEVATI